MPRAPRCPSLSPCSGDGQLPALPCPVTANEAPAQVLHAETSISLIHQHAAWHLTCMCPVTCPARRKIDPGLFSSLTTSGCPSSRWVSTLCIKQDGPTHTQMSGNVKHAGRNLHPPGQARGTETREKILTPSPKTTEILHIIINSSTGELHNALIITPAFHKTRHYVIKTREGESLAGGRETWCHTCSHNRGRPSKPELHVSATSRPASLL